MKAALAIARAGPTAVAAALDSHQHGSDFLHKLESRAAHQKVATRERTAKFAWTEEWQRLALDERALTSGLEKWMQDNAALPIDIACEDEDATDEAGAPTSAIGGPTFLEDSLADASSPAGDTDAPAPAAAAVGGAGTASKPATRTDADDSAVDDVVRTVGEALDRWRAGAYERALLQRVLADRVRQARASLQRLQSAQEAASAAAAAPVTTATRARGIRGDDALRTTKLPALAAAGPSRRPASGPAVLTRARPRPSVADSAPNGTAGSSADASAAIAAARSAYDAAVDAVWALRERQYEQEDAAERAAAAAQARAFAAVTYSLSHSNADAGVAAALGDDATDAAAATAGARDSAQSQCRGRDEIVDDNADLAAFQRALAQLAASASGTSGDDDIRAQVAAAVAAAQESLAEAFAALRADLKRTDDEEWLTQVASALRESGAAGKAYAQLVAATTAASSVDEDAAGGAPDARYVTLTVASTDATGWPAEAHRVYMHVFKTDAALGTAAAAASGSAGGSALPGTTPADVARARMVLSLMHGLAPPAPVSRAAAVDTDVDDPSAESDAATVAPPTELQLCVDLVRTPDVVLLHHRLNVARRMYRMRRAARREQWRRELSVAVREAQASIAAAAERAANEVAIASVRRAQQQRQRELHERLQSQRDEKEQQDAIAAAVAQELEEAELAVAEAKTAAQRAAAARKKAAIEAFRAEQAEMNAHAERIRTATAALIAEERAAEVAAGAVRVAKRYEEQAADRAKRSDAINAEAAALQASREASLQSLLASVPYFARLEEIKTTADTARTTGHTAASREAAAMSMAYAAFLRDVHAGADHVRGATLHGGVDLAIAADLAGSADGADTTDGAGSTSYAPGHADALRRLAVIRATEQGQFARTGYEDKRITRDPRWRLNAALRDAGLEGSAYARKALQAVPASGRGAVAAQRNASSVSLAWGDGSS